MARQRAGMSVISRHSTAQAMEHQPTFNVGDVPPLRHSLKLCERISPCPLSSILRTSSREDFSILRILHTPSPTTSVFSPVQHTYLISFTLPYQPSKHQGQERIGSHSRKPAAKLIQIFPSQSCFPRLAISGIACVSISSRLVRIPSLVRNPTMILGTPSKKDCAQNLRSLRSNFVWSLSFEIWAAVLSSTQLMGEVEGLEGLRSQTLLLGGDVSILG